MNDRPAMTAEAQQTDQIAEALAEVQAAMPTVGKGKTADTGKYKYTYADLADVSAAILPLLTEHGIAFTCTPREAGRGYELAGTLLHTSGQSISGALPLHGNDPQALGSSLTYARRYLLGCLTGIVTDDDDDARGAQSSTRSRAWDGPTTRVLIQRIEAAAASIGVDAERATQSLRKQTGTDVDTMFGLDPWVVQPHTERAEAHAAKTLADQQAAAFKADDDAEASARADVNG